MNAVYFTVAEALDAVSSEILHAEAEIKIVLTNENAGKQMDLSAFSVAPIPMRELFGEASDSLRFFLPPEELEALAVVTMAREILKAGAPAAIYIHSFAKGMPPLQSVYAQNVLHMEIAQGERLPLSVTLQNVYGNLAGAVFCAGAGMSHFLSWVHKRFIYNFRQGYSSIADTEHTGAQGDREAEFAFQWPGYASMHGISTEMQPVEERLTHHTRQQLFFTDGTLVHPLLKPYYMREYRLRTACKGNPFARRELFTDSTVVTGEEGGVPLTGMAHCIWLNRPDLQTAFPNPRAADRQGYMQWFAANAAAEYGLEGVYTEKVKAALLEQPEPSNPEVPAKTARWLFGRVTRKAAPSSSKQYEAGVNLCAHIRGEYGIGEASRMLACSLQAIRQPFTIVDIASERDRDYSNTQWMSRITNSFPYDVNVMYTNADGVAPFLQSISPDALSHRYNIGFWAWEMPEFPDEWLPAFAPFDEIWTLSQFSADAIATKSPVPVYSMPHPVALDPPDPRYTLGYFGLPAQSFVFLTMYDVRSVPQRKNPVGTIQAFLEAFAGREDVVLAVKINAPEGWEMEEDIAELTKGHPNIKFISEFVARPALNGLISACDAFVSLHRCEGFGFGPAEAMYYGKPAVLTAWSGSMEYTQSGACCPVAYTLMELDKNYGPYREGWHWAQPDIQDAAKQMKHLVEDKTFYNQVALEGQKLIKSKFSPLCAGQRIEKRLAAIRAGFSGSNNE